MKKREKREKKKEKIKHTLNQSENNSGQERKEDLQEFHFGHKIEMKMKKNNNQIQMGDPIRKKLRLIPFLDVKQVPCHLVIGINSLLGYSASYSYFKKRKTYSSRLEKDDSLTLKSFMNKFELKMKS